MNNLDFVERASTVAGGVPSKAAFLWGMARQSGLGWQKISLLGILGLLASFFSTLAVQCLGGLVNGVAGQATQGFSVIVNEMYTILAAMPALEDFQYKTLVLFAGLYVVIYFLYVVLRNIFGYYIGIWSEAIVLHMRKLCLGRILGAKLESSNKFYAGDLVHRVMNDSMQMNYLFAIPAQTIITDVVDIVWISFFVLLFDWRIFCILLLPVPFLILASKMAGKKQRMLAEKSQHIDGQCSTGVHRILAGLSAIKAFGAEQVEEQKFSTLTRQAFAVRKHSAKELALFFPAESMIRALGIIAAVAYTSYLSMQNILGVGAAPVVFLYAQRFYMPMGNWVRYYQIIQKGFASLKRLQAILLLEQEVYEKQPLQQNIYPFSVKGHVKLDSGKEVHLEIFAEKPDLFLLRGKSGAGKTQFLKSLLNLGVSFDGQIKVGGEAYQSSFALRHICAFASQDIHFVHGSIAENIGYPVTPEVIDRDYCQNLLESLDLQSFDLDFEVKEFGSNLSLGEKRRLALCRALYSSKPILILDEIDANVDMLTREKIYNIVRKEQQNRLVIMVSHAHMDEVANFSCQLVNVS